MIESEALDFPFVKSLPKRDKKKAVSMWEAFQELQRLTEKHGMLMPVRFAARILGVSVQRVYDLMNEDRLGFVKADGKIFVTGDSVTAYAKSERKAGCNLRYRDKAKLAFQYGGDLRETMTE